MENLIFSGESVPIEVASQVMKKTPSYIRQGLIQKSFMNVQDTYIRGVLNE